MLRFTNYKAETIAICQGSSRMNMIFFFSTKGTFHAAIWATSSLLTFGGFNQT